ncbi:MAG TPA: hypothetical protein VFA10_06310, partial [Ktedonobacteraceae bacterium]|nr:hypothetical protein [Ktedonobacteraceae bacterium]
RLTGRTAPSAATICTTELFYTDDTGIYLTRTRDLPPERLREFESNDDITRILGLSKAATYQLSQQRLTLPRQPPHFDEHNLWNSNQPVHAQAHHLELEFYDQFFDSGAYLRTHAEHMERWHTTLE